MPFSDWLHHLAVRGCLIAAALVLSIGDGRAQGNVPAPAQQPAQQRAAPAPPPAVHEQVADPGYYTVSCERPKDHDAADLCEQRRMAKAAEDAVWWARFQTFLGVLGFGAVLVSLIFTGWAAVAAGRAARAAQKSAESIPNIERAYVFFWDVERKDFKFTAGGGRHITIPTTGQTITYKNCGKTPAVIAMTRIGCDAFAAPPLPETAPEKELPSGAVIGAGDEWPRGEVSVTNEITERAKSQGTQIYLYGEITYHDIFKVERRTWFCRRWTGSQFVLGDLTDEKLNGYT